MSTDTAKAHRALELFEQAEGMMTMSAARAFIFFLELQDMLSTPGHIVETGVYKGKSATLLASYARDDEDLILVDVGYQEFTGHLDQIHNRNISVKARSEELRTAFEGYGACRGKVRVLHADASHTYSNVYNDLEIAHELLSEDGLVMLDDFLNMNFPQVQAATYAYIARNPEAFSMLLIGANKAFLCRPSRHRWFLNRCLTDFQPRTDALGDRLFISKSDANSEYDVLSFREHRPTDMARRYGESLYAHFYNPVGS